MLCARCTRFSEQIAGDPFIALIERGALQQVGIYEKEPFESYFSGNTIQICPVGRAHLLGVPLPVAALRPGLHPLDRRARRVRLGHPRRPPSRQGDASPLRRRPRGQRGVDHRQGPVRVHLRQPAGPADPPDGARHSTNGGEGGELRPASWPEAFAVAARGLAAARDGRRCRCADRWPAHRRGLLRLLQVRAGRARHQRHRLPCARPLRRGGRVPGRRRWCWTGPASNPVTYADLEAARSVVLDRTRARGRGGHDLPPAAQDRPRSAAADLLDRAVHLPRACTRCPAR